MKLFRMMCSSLKLSSLPRKIYTLRLRLSDLSRIDILLIWKILRFAMKLKIFPAKDSELISLLTYIRSLSSIVLRNIWMLTHSWTWWYLLTNKVMYLSAGDIWTLRKFISWLINSIASYQLSHSMLNTPDQSTIKVPPQIYKSLWIGNFCLLNLYWSRAFKEKIWLLSISIEMN